MKIFKRTILIFLLGYLMYWFPFVQVQSNGEWVLKPFSETRIMGVLQRIALAYCFASLLLKYVSTKGVLIISFLLLVVYWIILYFFGDAGQAFTIEGNAIKKLDLFVLGEGHIYKRGAIPFDPEGILSTIPCVVNVIAGYWVGIFIRQEGKNTNGLLKLIGYGLLLVLSALVWSLVFPISKKLWTSSFTLYTIGIDILILTVLTYFIELRKFKYGTYFFNVLGKNPLFIYLFSELVYTLLVISKVSQGKSIFEWISIDIFQHIVAGPFGSLLTGIWFMLVCWLIGWILDKRKIYIKI